MRFPENVFASVSTSLRAGHYNLLLGAGVSRDSTNRHGNLPTGEGIRKHLCDLKGAHANSSLQRVFSTLIPSEIQEHVVDRFLGCTPGPSLNKLTGFLWHRIFTFNVDDALEHAYQRAECLQTPSIFHFKDDFVETTNLSQIPIVHLHGWTGMPDKGFVFSRDEYVRQTTTINPWMVLLTQLFPVEPFVILGTSLDEVDLDFYLAHRTAVTSREDRGPSILVEPNPDAITETDCKKYDLLLYKGTAEEFLDDLLKHVPNRPTPIELISRRTRNLLPSTISEIAALSFASDFELVPGVVLQDPSVSRFFYGQSPTWQDLASNKDVSRPPTTQILRSVDSHLNQHPQAPRILLVEDPTGAGKSTLIRRCAFELAATGLNVLLCSPTSRIEPVSSATIVNRIPGPLVIVVDDFADHVVAIREFAEHLVKPDVMFLCAERSYRQKYIAQALSGFPIEVEVVSGLRVGRVDAARLIERYREFGLLGAADALRNGARFADAIESDPIAIACCRILNYFRPLERIVGSLLDTTSEQALKRYLTSALAHHCFRGGVRLSVLSAISGRADWSRQITIHHELPLSYNDEDHDAFVIPENTTLAPLILDRVSKTNKALLLSVFVDLANAIVSRVNSQEIKRRSPEARIAARLFDFDQIVFPFLGGHSTRLYLQTKRSWSWNSRYWSQVALMYLTRFYDSPSSEEGKIALENACSHARHARTIELHPVVLSTLGKVLFAQVVENGPAFVTLFDEAFSVLTKAIELQRNWMRPAGHPFVTLFRGTSDYIASGGKISSKQTSVLWELHRDAEVQFEGDIEVDEALVRFESCF